MAVSIGGAKTVEILRGSALALGVDKAILVKVFISCFLTIIATSHHFSIACKPCHQLPKDDTEVEPLAVAKILKGIVEKVKPDVVLCGISPLRYLPLWFRSRSLPPSPPFKACQ